MDRQGITIASVYADLQQWRKRPNESTGLILEGDARAILALRPDIDLVVCCPLLVGLLIRGEGREARHCL